MIIKIDSSDQAFLLRAMELNRQAQAEVDKAKAVASVAEVAMNSAIAYFAERAGKDLSAGPAPTRVELRRINGEECLIVHQPPSGEELCQS